MINFAKIFCQIKRFSYKDLSLIGRMAALCYSSPLQALHYELLSSTLNAHHLIFEKANQIFFPDIFSGFLSTVTKSAVSGVFIVNFAFYLLFPVVFSNRYVFISFIWLKWFNFLFAYSF